jgi:hypothetical protein
MSEIEIIKQYVSDWYDIMGSVEAEYMSTRRMKKYIAKKWNVPFDVICDLHKKAERYFNKSDE